MTWWKHICSSLKSPTNNQNQKIFLTNGLHFRPNSKVHRFYRPFTGKLTGISNGFLDLWEREVRRFIKEAKLAEKRLAQAKVEEMRKQHNSSRENQRTSTTSGDTTGCSTPPMRKSKLKSRLRESKTMDQIKSWTKCPNRNPWTDLWIPVPKITGIKMPNNNFFHSTWNFLSNKDNNENKNLN